MKLQLKYKTANYKTLNSHHLSECFCMIASFLGKKNEELVLKLF